MVVLLTCFESSCAVSSVSSQTSLRASLKTLYFVGYSRSTVFVLANATLTMWTERDSGRRALYTDRWRSGLGSKVCFRFHSKVVVRPEYWYIYTLMLIEGILYVKPSKRLWCDHVEIIRRGTLPLFVGVSGKCFLGKLLIVEHERLW